MNLFVRFNLVALFFFVLLGCSSSSGPGVVTPPPPPPPTDQTWSTSSCTTITGSAFLGLSLDGGQTIVDDGIGSVPAVSVFSFGMAKTGVDSLVAAVDGTILVSVDVGCTWTPIAELGTNAVQILTNATENIVYAYNPSAAQFHQINLGTGAVLTRQAPQSTVSTLWADPDNSDHIRISAGPTRQLYDSTDGGSTFSLIGVPATAATLYYFTAIDPIDENHIIQGTVGISGENGAGVWTSFDGGTTWAQAQGFTGRINGFTGRISEANSNHVWVLGLDLDDPSIARRKIYYSTDGGLNFTPVVTASNGVPLSNAVELWPDPTQDGRVLFSLTDPPNVATRFTTIYDYQHDTASLQGFAHFFETVGEMRVIVFNPDHNDNIFFSKTYQLLTAEGPQMDDYTSNPYPKH